MPPPTDWKRQASHGQLWRPGSFRSPGEDHHRQEWRQHCGDRGIQHDNEASIELRQVKYLNNIVEQDHRAIKRMTRPMLGFKSFWSVAITLAGIELMHIISNGQLKGRAKSRPAQQFYSLAA